MNFLEQPTESVMEHNQFDLPPPSITENFEYTRRNQPSSEWPI